MDRYPLLFPRLVVPLGVACFYLGSAFRCKAVSCLLEGLIGHHALVLFLGILTINALSAGQAGLLSDVGTMTSWG